MLIELHANLHGKGGVSVKEEEVKVAHNLTETSLLMVRSMMIGLSTLEFFQEGKKELFANDLVIADEKTGRKFSYTLTAKEI